MIYFYKYDFPTLNEYIEAERTNRFLASKMKKSATNAVKIMTLEQHPEKLEGLLDVQIVWGRKDNKHDPDNIYFAVKFILDGIVKAGVLPGDGRKNIRNIFHYIDQTIENSCMVQFLKA